MFALLDEVGKDPERLKPVWDRLSVLLEVPADAEERLPYPRLLTVGAGAGGPPRASDEAKDAIHDHEGIRRASHHPVGSDDWWQAVIDTRTAKSNHMAEEEREALADFRRHAAPQTRHELGIEFAVYEAPHTGGVSLVGKDPDRYVANHTR